MNCTDDVMQYAYLGSLDESCSYEDEMSFLCGVMALVNHTREWEDYYLRYNMYYYGYNYSDSYICDHTMYHIDC